IPAGAAGAGTGPAFSAPGSVSRVGGLTTANATANATAPTGAPAALLPYAAAAPNTAAVSSAVSPYVPPPAPPPGATVDQKNQNIDQLMQFLESVNQQGNPGHFTDWEDPKITHGPSLAPNLPPISGRALDQNCNGLAAGGLSLMKRYLERCEDQIHSDTGNVAITDFSTNEPVTYVLRQDGLSCVGSTRMTFGVGSSQSNPPTAGNAHENSPKRHRTPAGFFVTVPHWGSSTTIFHEWNSVGLRGLGDENDETEARGVVMHASNGHTKGCLGMPPSRFITMKDLVSYGSVMLNYFPGQIGSSQNHCPSSQRKAYHTHPTQKRITASEHTTDQASVPLLSVPLSVVPGTH
ncbi:MAG: hypothetical protein C5B49_07765, partial [Bdellovibrio sp.]